MLEVLLVLMLLGLLVAFVAPNLSGEMRRRSLTESADRLRSLIIITHAKAMEDGVRYRIEFPGTPDPLDEDAEKTIDVPVETRQPNVIRQDNPIGRPDQYGGFDAPWKKGPILMEGTRCVMAYHGTPSFDTEHGGEIAGRPFGEGDEVEFVSLTLNPEGTCDWITFVLTDLPWDVELKPYHAHRILNVVVDGRTGHVWIQRSLTVDELEVIQDEGGSPVFHRDFLLTKLLTDEDISVVDVFQNKTGAIRGRLRGAN